MGADRLRGNVELLLLAVLVGEPGHGYAVIARLREVTGGEFDLPEGSVYPALHRLERAGLLRSSWAVGALRRRRIYSLTTAGGQALAERRTEWDRFAAAIRCVLALPGVASPAGAS